MKLLKPGDDVRPPTKSFNWVADIHTVVDVDIAYRVFREVMTPVDDYVYKVVHHKIAESVYIFL